MVDYTSFSATAKISFNCHNGPLIFAYARMVPYTSAVSFTTLKASSVR
jgi:hypothetical protein